MMFTDSRQLSRLTLADAKTLPLYAMVMSPHGENWVVIFRVVSDWAQKDDTSFVLISEDETRRRHIDASGLIKGGWYRVAARTTRTPEQE